jgi:hypothetical protein
MALFDDPFVRADNGGFDVATDGRFLMVRPEPPDWETPDEIHIVLNWTGELEARVVPNR